MKMDNNRIQFTISAYMYSAGQLYTLHTNYRRLNEPTTTSTAQKGKEINDFIHYAQTKHTLASINSQKPRRTMKKILIFRAATMLLFRTFKRIIKSVLFSFQDGLHF